MLFVPPGYYYWKRVESKQFTNYFNSNEFSCKCGKCEEQMISKELVYKLECLRNLIHSPLKINEGFRCKGHQEDLKRRGYETSKGISQHELGNAVDLHLHENNKKLILEYCFRIFKCLGIANSFLHIDLRDDKNRVWLYTK